MESTHDTQTPSPKAQELFDEMLSDMSAFLASPQAREQAESMRSMERDIAWLNSLGN